MSQDQKDLHDLQDDPMGTAEAAAALIRDRSGVNHQVALVMGSGWIDAVSTFTTDGVGEELSEIPLDDLPGLIQNGIEQSWLHPGSRFLI